MSSSVGSLSVEESAGCPYSTGGAGAGAGAGAGGGGDGGTVACKFVASGVGTTGVPSGAVYCGLLGSMAMVTRRRRIVTGCCCCVRRRSVLG